MDIKLTTLRLTGLFSSIFPLLSLASAFQEWEQSITSLGVAHADMAAGANDFDTAYYNPAGMTRLDKPGLTLGVVGIQQHSKLYDGVAVFPEDNLTLPANSYQKTLYNAIPNFHAVLPLETENDLRFALSVVSPFGGESMYNHDPQIEIYTEKTYLAVTQINPSIAFELFENFSVGGGLGFEYMQSQFSAVNTSLGGYEKANVNLDDWATTWNAGLLYEITPHTRVGATYRPKVVHDQTGTFELTSDAGEVLTVANGTLVLPATTTFGIFQDLTEDWAAMFTAAYTEWDVLESFVVSSGFNSEVLPPATTELNWSNSWFFALGTTYDLYEDWQLRAGVSFDATPTNDEFRELRIPDSDRYGFSAGLGYELLEDFTIDLAYQYIASPSVPTTSPFLSGFFAPSTGPTIQFDVKSYAQLLGIQFTWEFGDEEIEPEL